MRSKARDPKYTRRSLYPDDIYHVSISEDSSYRILANYKEIEDLQFTTDQLRIEHRVDSKANLQPGARVIGVSSRFMRSLFALT